ncbi:MAG: hypothetical protein DLM52_07265 [Chthoniobacterales bacterium]|nr:MAG: hypothetical protein DLM52_07265 [Chthoniobacterales bacterium]
MSRALAIAFGIGFIAGLRSMTAPAATAWAAHLGWLHLQRAAVAWMRSLTAALIFSILAFGEMIADKLPMTPKRTALGPLLVRVVSGMLCGACVTSAARFGLISGAVLGGAGAVAGAFAGYEFRRRLPPALHAKDAPIAIAEDMITLGLAIFLLSS